MAGSKEIRIRETKSRSSVGHLGSSGYLKVLPSTKTAVVKTQPKGKNVKSTKRG